MIDRRPWLAACGLALLAALVTVSAYLLSSTAIGATASPSAWTLARIWVLYLGLLAGTAKDASARQVLVIVGFAAVAGLAAPLLPLLVQLLPEEFATVLQVVDGGVEAAVFALLLVLMLPLVLKAFGAKRLRGPS